MNPRHAITGQIGRASGNNIIQPAHVHIIYYFNFHHIMLVPMSLFGKNKCNTKSLDFTFSETKKTPEGTYSSPYMTTPAKRHQVYLIKRYLTLCFVINTTVCTSKG